MGNTYRFDHIMQRLQYGNHSLGISFGKVQPRSLFQAFMPQLVPENCHTDELVTDGRSLGKGIDHQQEIMEGTGQITCSTIVALCSRIASMIVRAALFRAALEDLEATVSG
jgi:hypothetical protein